MDVCCFPDCTTAVSKPHVTCPHHWYALPARVQAEVQARIRGWKDPGAAREFIVSWHRISLQKANQ